MCKRTCAILCPFSQHEWLTLRVQFRCKGRGGFCVGASLAVSDQRDQARSGALFKWDAMGMIYDIISIIYLYNIYIYVQWGCRDVVGEVTKKRFKY